MMMNQTAPEIGHNQPPADANPIIDRLGEDYAATVNRGQELLEAAERAPATVEDEDAAEKVTDFIRQIGAAIKVTEAARIGEKEDYLEGGRTVDGFFKKILKPLADAKADITARLTVYQKAKADAERKVREDVERTARVEAERLEKEAADKAAALREEADLAGAVAAEEAAKAAQKVLDDAAKAASVKVAELSRTRGDLGGVGSLQTFFDFRALSRETLALEPLRQHLPADALEKAVRSYIKAGGRKLAGVEIFENHRTTVR
jgi:flagellin-like hook-associated protein FlgL